VVGDGEAGSGLYEVAPAAWTGHAPSHSGRGRGPGAVLPGEEGRLLVIAGGEEARLRLQLYDRRSTPWRRWPPSTTSPWPASTGATARAVHASGQPGLWQADMALSLASVRQVDAAVPKSPLSAWSVVRDGRSLLLRPHVRLHLRTAPPGRLPAPVLCVDRTAAAAPAVSA
jgi:hypothetical protein